MTCGEVTPESMSAEVEDIETLLTALRANAEEAMVAGIGKHEGEHPSVSFYRGNRPVKVHIPPQDNPQIETDDVSCLHVIGLHQALLPPCQGTQYTEEERSARLSSTDGLELLRVNWELLLWLLMPSVRTSVLSQGGEVCDDGGEKVDGRDDASTPICSLQELQRPLAWKDYTQLRQPGMMDRVHYSYVVFIRFYGWRIHDEESGVLDRHQNWRVRYKALLQSCKENNNKQDGMCCGLRDCCFYSALTRILRVLLDLCFTHYAVNLVAFILEEMSKGRLLMLQSSLESSWLPQVIQCKQVPVAERERLQCQLYHLTHSDSD